MEKNQYATKRMKYSDFTEWIFSNDRACCIEPVSYTIRVNSGYSELIFLISGQTLHCELCVYAALQQQHNKRLHNITIMLSVWYINDASVQP